jgi:hypothetical protein
MRFALYELYAEEDGIDLPDGVLLRGTWILGSVRGNVRFARRARGVPSMTKIKSRTFSFLWKPYRRQSQDEPAATAGRAETYRRAGISFWMGGCATTERAAHYA